MSKSSGETIEHLTRLARKIRANPAYLASALAAFQAQERLSDEDLARRLVIDVGRLPCLALCKRPSPQRPDFAQQVEQIAAYSGADQFALAKMIRQIDAIAQLTNLPATGETKTLDKPIPSQSGLVAAARDRNVSNSDKEPDQDAGTEDQNDS